MLDRARALQPKLVQLRRHIHAHPELGFQEFQTGQFVSDTLTSLGVEHMRGVARTGVVALLAVVALQLNSLRLPHNSLTR